MAAKRIENLIYTRAVLRCNAPGQQQLHHSAPASNSSTIAPRPATASRWRSARAPRPAASCQQHLSCHGALASIFSMALRYGALASNNSATAPRQQQLRYGALASNKPHPAEKSTPVWLAIWRTWAGFANSQHRDAAFATPDNICAHSSLLQTLSSCSDRRKSVGPSAPIAYATYVSPPNEAVAWPCTQVSDG